ncbi:hypothetical protein NAEGRDRAFT_78247 [Naegleria gruberi]|uniref:Uncharacterized protein FM175 n=1 Tax=Naegleria gruberi TaxID=5762 RepID=D2V263_NAEGR|nr:uncharacterized protein NAEGRDRAFT_78247 [Naegleria gruberi]EFC48997.1 hypothetical protein NAEGRDRAFT_78247 [Naegleria gruberi]|eukprot:XP_002681741.1 hypothetical protein NAEGRDRAFT_78247 [Naegleria gruberi strain NEG-M]
MQDIAGEGCGEVNDGVILVMIGGLPACGKTSLCKKIQTYLEDIRMECKLFCYDEVLNEELEDGGFTSEKWKKSRNLIYKQTIKTINEFKCIVKSGWKIIILDDNFYYKSMRHEFVQICQEFTIAHIQIILKCNVETCIERDAKRSQPVGEDIIRSMNIRFEYGKSSFSDNIIYMEYDTDNFSEMDSISSKIIDLFPLAKPLQDLNKMKQEMKEESQRQNEQSFKKQLDDSLRKKTSHLIQHNLIKKEHAKKLSDLKKDILKSVSQCDDISYYEHLFDEKVKEFQ